MEKSSASPVKLIPLEGGVRVLTVIGDGSVKAEGWGKRSWFYGRRVGARCCLVTILKCLEKSLRAEVDVCLTEQLQLDFAWKLQGETNDVGDRAEGHLGSHEVVEILLDFRHVGDQASEGIEQFPLEFDPRRPGDSGVEIFERFDTSDPVGPTAFYLGDDLSAAEADEQDVVSIIFGW